MNDAIAKVTALRHIGGGTVVEEQISDSRLLGVNFETIGGTVRVTHNADGAAIFCTLKGSLHLEADSNNNVTVTVNPEAE